MLKTLLFGNDSLEGILSAFTKTIEKLDALTQRNADAIATKTAQMTALADQRDALYAESDKAATVRTKLQELING